MTNQNTEFLNVMKFLEETKSGAKMMDDFEMVARLDRAMVAFSAALDKDIFKENILEDIL